MTTMEAVNVHSNLKKKKKIQHIKKKLIEFKVSDTKDLMQSLVGGLFL